MNLEIANRLVQLRKQNNYSQEELAAKLGLSRQAVSKWERAEASPDTDNLILLARLYQISLDDLLFTKDPIPEAEPDKTEKEEAYARKESSSQAEDEKKEGKNYVHIGLGGIHVKDGDEEVHVGLNGVHVIEHGGSRTVHVEKGHCCINGEEVKREKSVWNLFPYPILVVIVYLLCGFFGWLGGWAIAWILFLTIPLYYTAINAVEKWDWNHFAYPVLVVIVYLLCGFFGWLGGWAIAWILFLTIPLYYTAINAVKKRDWNHFAYPVLVTAVFFLLGFFYQLWHPGWMIFLTLPIYYGVVNMIRKTRKNRR